MSLRASVLVTVFASLLTMLASAGTVNQEARLLAFDGQPGDEFGSAVAVDGDRVLIGARGAAVGTANFAGAAYMFVRETGSWSIEDKLIAPVPAVADSFGTSVALDGDTAFIGTPGDEAGAPNSGSVYVFVRRGSQWFYLTRLSASDPGQQDQFGGVVALDGDTAIVGARWDDDDGPSSGAAYVFTRSGGVWSQQAKLTASDAAEDAWFGDAVDLAGDKAVIGAPFTGGKAAYVFTRTGTSWSEQAKLVDPGIGSSAFFGTTVAISAGTVLVGSPLGSAGTSLVSVFKRSGTSWSLDTRLFAPNDVNDFGASVAVDRNLAIAGAPGIFGQAWYFTREDGVWSAANPLEPVPATSVDEYGNAVAVDGGTIVVGARENDDIGDDAGAAYVFELPIVKAVPAVGYGGALLLIAMLLGGSYAFIRRRDRAEPPRFVR